MFSPITAALPSTQHENSKLKEKICFSILTIINWKVWLMNERGFLGGREGRGVGGGERNDKNSHEK